MGTEIQYHLKRLRPEKTATILERGGLSELAQPLTGEPFQLEQAIPSVAGKEGRNSYLRLDQIFLGQSEQLRAMTFVKFRPCSKQDCAKEKQIIDEKNLSFSSWKIMAPGNSIEKAYLGDLNKDGLNDVLLQMSDGAAWAFYSRVVRPNREPDF